jgi:hypothetical protein
MAWPELESDVRRKRRAGVVTMLTMARPAGMASRHVADRLAESAQYSAIGDSWLPLPRDAALQLVHDILARDLAYDDVVMPSTEAQELASRFLAHVGEVAEYFTNGSWLTRPDLSWEPLSQATFDAGVVAVGGDSAAMLWVEDED